MITYLFFPVGWIMREQYFKGILIHACKRFIQIANFYKTLAPVLHADKAYLLPILFNLYIFIQQQAIIEFFMLAFYFFKVSRFFLLTVPFNIIAVIMVSQNRKLPI